MTPLDLLDEDVFWDDDKKVLVITISEFDVVLTFEFRTSLTWWGNLFWHWKQSQPFLWLHPHLLCLCAQTGMLHMHSQCVQCSWTTMLHPLHLQDSLRCVHLWQWPASRAVHQREPKRGIGGCDSEWKIATWKAGPIFSQCSPIGKCCAIGKLAHWSPFHPANAVSLSSHCSILVTRIVFWANIPSCGVTLWVQWKPRDFRIARFL